MLTAPPSAMVNRRLLRLALDDRPGMIERRDARAKVYPEVSRILNLWEHDGSQD